MNKEIFKSVSYGMYIVSSNLDKELVGCVINTFCQINSIDSLVSISLNKNNYTNEVIRKGRRFSVSVISNDTKREVIGKFGYSSSRDINKFDGISYDMIGGLPVVLENVCGYFICEVVNIIDCNSHDIIVARVVEACKLEDRIPMTYKYYHEVLKGLSPKNAPTFIEESSNSKEDGVFKKYKCSLCGYIYDEEKEDRKFDDLDDDWCCPLCGAKKHLFEKI